MPELTVLRDLALIVGLAIPVVAIAHRLRIPPLIGFLLVGVGIGPAGTGLIPEVEEVAELAEIGVVLLLFEIGLELSLSQVLGWGRSVLVAAVPVLLEAIVVDSRDIHSTSLVYHTIHVMQTWQES